MTNHSAGAMGKQTNKARQEASSVAPGYGERQIHRLVDDIVEPVRTYCGRIRRDPLVEALFGAPTARRLRKPR
jgi:hypothetical protein